MFPHETLPEWYGLSSTSKMALISSTYEQGCKEISIRHEEIKKQARTLRLVNRALMQLTKGDNEMTIAPSLRSKNLGRKASFTVVN